MTGYIIQANGRQFSPEGEVDPPVNEEENNSRLEDLAVETMKNGLPVVLYLTTDEDNNSLNTWPVVSTWGGTWKVNASGHRSSWHNMAGRGGRRDVWFHAFGHNWHGVNIGSGQILRCKTVKGQG